MFALHRYRPPCFFPRLLFISSICSCPYPHAVLLQLLSSRLVSYILS